MDQLGSLIMPSLRCLAWQFDYFVDGNYPNVSHPRMEAGILIFDCSPKQEAKNRALGIMGKPASTQPFGLEPESSNQISRHDIKSDLAPAAIDQHG